MDANPRYGKSWEQIRIKEVNVLTVYKTRMNIGLGIWFILSLLQVILKKSGYGNSFFYTFTWLSVMVAMIISCYASAKGKGHTGVWGLLGILSILGFVVLILFPDKNK